MRRHLRKLGIIGAVLALAAVLTWAALPSDQKVVEQSPAVSSSESLGLDQERLANLFTNDFAEEPAFKCAHGRNKGLGVNEMARFIPCPNGALQLTVDHGNMSLVNTTDTVVFRDFKDLYTAKGWAVGLQSPNSEINLVAYAHSLNIKLFQTYVSTNDGPWTLVVNLNDLNLSTKNKYDMVLTWTDAFANQIPAPVPFIWDCVQNTPYDDVLC